MIIVNNNLGDIVLVRKLSCLGFCHALGIRLAVGCHAGGVTQDVHWCDKFI
jgi:hypothetical protein